MRTIPVVVLLAVLTGCRSGSSDAEFPKLTEEFVYKTLAFSPVWASGQGLHSYGGVNFDTQLDDVSRNAIQRQRDFYSDFHQRLEGFKKSSLSAEDQADYDIMEGQIAQALFDIDLAQSWAHSPQSYVELLGNALYNPFVLEYAPKADRFRHIIARMDKAPQFMETARRQLRVAPRDWIQVAEQENDGNIDLIDKTLRTEVPSELKSEYDAAASPALDALRSFNRFLKDDMPKRGNSDWR